MNTPLILIPPPPVIEHLARKRKTLERRRDHLTKRIDDVRRDGSAATYDEAEKAALTDAIAAIDYVEQMTKLQEGGERP